jgi:serine/threonine-protein kinase
MTDDPRIEQLLDQLLNGHATPEEVCTSCPELLPVVRNRWRQMRRLRADLDALFPPPDAPSTRVDAPSPPEPTPQPRGTGLPQIPGYEVEAVLGRGGMGVVYQARHLRLNRPVAEEELGLHLHNCLEAHVLRREAEALLAQH